MKTIRIKTDYQELLEKDPTATKPPNQVSTKNTEEFSNKIVYLSKA